MQIARKRNFLMSSNALPTGMEEVEYIEKTEGSTTTGGWYISDEAVHADKRRFSITFSFKTKQTGDIKHCCLGGNFVMWQSGANNGTRFWGVDGEWHDSSMSSEAGKIFKLYADYNVDGGAIYGVKGSNLINTGKHINGLTNDPGEVVLFNNGTQPTSSSAKAGVGFRIHHFESISYDPSYPSMIWIPVTYKGEVGFYDTIGKKFIRQSNTTNGFAAGPKKNKDYTKLSYIQSTGTQYLDSGIFPDLETEVQVDMEWCSGIGYADWNCIVCGESSDDGSDSLKIRQNGSGSTFAWRFDSKSVNGTKSFTVGTRYLLKLNKTGFYVDDSLIDSVNATSFPVPGKSILIMTDPNHVERKAKMKLYALRIYKSNVAVRNLIPVEDPDGTVCMYDTIANEYLYNQGSGTFTAGPWKQTLGLLPIATFKWLENYMEVA